MWTSQVHFDVRYEANDVVNRVLKCFHLVLFVYIGSASGGWDLEQLMKVDIDQLEASERVKLGK